jgi:thioredoxin reductase (NADPH)
MGVLFEQILIYGITALLIVGILFIYIRKQRRESNEVDEKITQAKEDGLHEPVSLYPVIDPNRCIKSGACVTACPEHDIIGIRNGRATVINTSQCIGHGACFKACPVEAISLWIGTEKRGVDLPNVDSNFQTNIQGLYIAGEIGGMGLIRNAVTQGREATENIVKSLNKSVKAEYDLLVVGGGPAGISATLAAKKAGLSVITLEQDTLGGTVATFPRSKIIMTHPMDLPLYGKVKLFETNKMELLNLWNDVISKNNLIVKENSKVESIVKADNVFTVETVTCEKYTAKSVLLAIGRRGTPRKLNVSGEMTEKVAYRLLEPEEISGKKIVIVGGGDSAVEAALSLCEQNSVTLSYRGENFTRLKKKNAELIHEAKDNAKINIKFNTNLSSIDPNSVSYTENSAKDIITLENDLVYIFAGGELPTQFLKKIGIQVTTKYGEAVLKHK